MDASPNLRLLTDAYVAMLASATGRPWGATDAPGDQDAPTSKPYGLVMRIPGGSRFGDPSRPTAMATVIFQLTAVGKRTDQADWLMARAIEATFALGVGGWTNAITATGLAVIGRRHDTDGGTTPEGAVVNSIERVAFTVTTT